jgi:folate-binding protein YgfZ
MVLIEHYNAARNASAVTRQDWMGVLQLTGPERVAWLQGMISNDVEKLSPGQGCYAGHLNAQGKLVAQMIVLLDREEILLLVEKIATTKLAAVFDKLIVMEDVQVRDASADFELLALTGPLARMSLEAWTGNTFPENALYTHQLLPQGRVVSSDLGYQLIVPREEADVVLRDVMAAGAVEIGDGTWDILRTEAGMPVYGVDIDETTTMPELGQKGISYDKGCYIGQEVVARIKYIGHVNRRFVGFVCEGSVLPESRAVVQSGGKDAGYVTTAVFSPGLGKAVALGFVNRASAEPETAVVLAGKEASVAAQVAALPFL